MKIIWFMASLVTILACGIVSAGFDLPERYAQREITQDEMPGIWHVTPESEAKVDDFTNKYPAWGASAPWRQLTLYTDGSCQIEFESAWLGDTQSELNSRIMESCSWSLAQEENPSHKISSALKLRLDFANNVTTFFSLYIYEENDQLILWDFIGDSDDFIPQDFVRID